jgi:dTDP-4-dehydrorhamnose 3,5-epimerase
VEPGPLPRSRPAHGVRAGQRVAVGDRQLWIPPGFAHGFLVLSDHALVAYKCTEPYDPAAQGTILWNDPDIGIDWPEQPRLISPKDRAARPLRAVAEWLPAGR